MRITIFFIAILILTACSVQKPKDQEVKQVVSDWYAQKSSLAGAGIWDVFGVTVLSIERDPNNKKQFNTASRATGTYHAPPSTPPKPDQPFSDTVTMKLEWNGSKWITVEK